MRRSAKIDANQPEIVKAFRDMGCSVLHMHQLGHGAPDICVGYGGLSMLIEIKDGSKPPSGQKLTADEQTWWDSWTGGVRIVKDIDGVIKTVETLKRWHYTIISKAG